MIETLIICLIVGCVLALIYYIVTRFVADQRVRNIVAAVLALIFILILVRQFRIFV